MTSIKDVVEATLGILNRIDVRGRDNVLALSLAMQNLENIVKAFKDYDAKNKTEQEESKNDPT